MPNRPTLLLAALLLTSAAHAGTAPFLKGPYVQDVSNAGAIIKVELDAPAPVVVDVEPFAAGDASVGRHSVQDAAAAFHVVRLPGLQASTRYRYTVHTPASALTGEFTTAPPPDATAPIHFLVYGDNRTDANYHAAVVQGMTQSPGDFLVNTGDLVGSGSAVEDWQTFFDIEGPLIRNRPLFACIGNHELIELSGTNYQHYFGDNPIDAATRLPLYRSFRWGMARFFLLNGEVDHTYRATGITNPGAWSTERDWFKRELERADAEAGLRWKIVVIHHGPYSSGPHGDNKEMVEAGIVDLMKQHKVNMIFEGHDHIYERGDSDGLRYIVSGGGGAPLYDIKSPRDNARKVVSAHHFVEVTLSPDTMSIVAKRTDGTILDQCEGPREGLWACDAPAPASAPATAPVLQRPAPATKTESRCGCRVVGSPLTGSSGWALAFLAALGLCAKRRRAVRR